MPGSLVLSAYEPVGVLHGAGYALQGVGLHLAQVDYAVRLGDLTGEIKLLCGGPLREIHADGLVHVRNGRAVQTVGQSQRCGSVPAASHGGGVAVLDLCAAGFAEDPQHASDHRRIRSDGPGLVAAVQEVGFYQNIISGTGKAADPSDKIYSVFHNFADVFLRVVFASEYRYFGSDLAHKCYSIYALTFFRSSGISRCWGQASMHCPHSMQSAMLAQALS